MKNSRAVYSLAMITILLLCTQVLLAQNASNSLLARGEKIESYVLCNGKKVKAIYKVRDRSNRKVMLGVNSYSTSAIDTTLKGKIEVPATIMAPNGLPYKVIAVSRRAFADCRHIVEVVLPDSIYDIGDQSFMNCRSLRSIVLPVGTRYLWPYAFRGCNNLRRIEVKASVPPDSYNDVFDDHTLRFATLVVPSAHAKSYRNAFVWNMFRYSISNWDLRR